MTISRPLLESWDYSIHDYKSVSCYEKIATPVKSGNIAVSHKQLHGVSLNLPGSILLVRKRLLKKSKYSQTVGELQVKPSCSNILKAQIVY